MGTSDVDQLAWNDLSVYIKRRRKAANALVRVAEAVLGHPELRSRCREFDSCYSALLAADPAAFTTLWSEPYAYHWARTADQHLRHGLATRNGVEELVAHLELIKLFAAGLAILTGSTHPFEAPLSLPAPLSIPATKLSLISNREIELLGVDDGRLIVRHDGRREVIPTQPAESWDHPGMTREFCPEVPLEEGAQMRLQPAALQLPRSVAAAQTLPPVSLQHRLCDKIEHAVALIDQHLPDMYPQLRYAARIVVLKPVSDSGPQNSSFSRFPGALLIGACENSYELAEDIIHEAHHNRLYAIEEAGPFFEDHRVHSTREERFYSPWRADPRPLYGIFHAVYVFSRVQRYWLNVSQCNGSPQAVRDYAAQRWARLRLQLAAGTAELEANADFTPLGAKLFHCVVKEVQEVQQAGQSAGLRIDLPAFECTESGDFVAATGVLSGKPVSVAEADEEHRMLFERTVPEFASV